MITRIRYIDGQVPGTKITKPILAVTQLVFVTMNPVKGSYVIMTTAGVELKRGVSTNHHLLKKTIKKELINLGVEFAGEVRHHTGGVVKLDVEGVSNDTAA